MGSSFCWPKHHYAAHDYACSIFLFIHGHVQSSQRLKSLLHTFLDKAEGDRAELSLNSYTVEQEFFMLFSVTFSTFYAPRSSVEMLSILQSTRSLWCGLPRISVLGKFHSGISSSAVVCKFNVNDSTVCGIHKEKERFTDTCIRFLQKVWE